MVLLPPQSTAKEEAACKLQISSLYLGVCNYGSDINVVNKKCKELKAYTVEIRENRGYFSEDNSTPMAKHCK